MSYSFTIIEKYPQLEQTKIHFIVPEFQISEQNGNKKIRCQIRNKEVAFTPEEFVRQTVLHYLINEKKIAKSKINVEKELIINTRKKRIDIIVFEKGKPNLLIECKAPEIKINRNTLMQLADYNQSVKASFLLITNLGNSFLLETATMKIIPEY